MRNNLVGCKKERSANAETLAVSGPDLAAGSSVCWCGQVCEARMQIHLLHLKGQHLRVICHNQQHEADTIKANTPKLQAPHSLIAHVLDDTLSQSG